ncbi:MAG: cysteine desulfurase NifS [Oscillospiraceae bacterium]|nr:cysteine desulfurase NifS [Oscillospiraceae bacterium]
MNRFVYVDNAATTCVYEEVISAMEPFFKKNYGNASSIYGLGRESSIALEKARSDIAECINAEKNEIFFTSGGSESDNWAIKCAVSSNKNRIISSPIEHHAVMHSINSLVKKGFLAKYVSIDNFGLISPENVSSLLDERTALVSVMMANNEIGTIEPIEEIAAICREKNVLFHTDAVQAVGHIEVDVKKLGIDMLSMSAHKFHGPKGVGALFLRNGVKLPPFMDGGAQEDGMRAGTENIAGIVGMAKALEIATGNLRENCKKIEKMRNKIINNLMKIKKTRLTGHPEKRLPGNASFCFEGIEGESILLSLDACGICASTGSACTSKSLEPSHVLLAIGLPHKIAHGSLRITFCEDNNEDDVDYILEKLPLIVEKLRLMSPIWNKDQQS